MRSYVCITLGLLALAGCSKSATDSKPSKAMSERWVATSAETSASAAVAPKAGLWSVTHKRDEMGYEATTQICADDRLAARIAGLPDITEAMTCAKHEVTATADGQQVERVCTRNDTTVTFHVSITIPSDSEFHQVSETIYDPAFAGHADVHMTADGIWKGACPAGMKPGDRILADGSKINLYAVKAVGVD
ncbi:MAG: DUF3617 family protein [Asticcacaulis sp.]|nr:DUF3617 family protein [Asticcacaulis sp.]